MGWYFLQGVAFTLGVASSLIWYEPGGPVSARDATLAAAGIGTAMAIGATMLASALLNRRIKQRESSASHERIAGHRDALAHQEGIERVERRRLLFWRRGG